MLGTRLVFMVEVRVREVIHAFPPILHFCKAPKCPFLYPPQPQPQPRQIRAESSTYITAHGNARSLTHGARPGIEPASSGITSQIHFC